MRTRLRDFLSTLGVAGALFTLVEPSWRAGLLRLLTLLAPAIGRRFGIVPRTAFLFGVGRLIEGSAAKDRPAGAPSLVRLLAEASVGGAQRVLGRRGRWGLRGR